MKWISCFSLKSYDKMEKGKAYPFANVILSENLKKKKNGNVLFSSIFFLNSEQRGVEIDITWSTNQDAGNRGLRVSYGIQAVVASRRYLIASLSVLKGAI